MAMLAGEVGGGALLGVSGRRIGAALQQQLHKVQVAVGGGLLQGRDAVLLHGVDVGARLNQRARDLRSRPRQCGVQRGHPERVARRRVHLATARQQQRGGFGSAEEACQAKRLKTIAGPGVNGGWLLAQQCLEAWHDAHRGGLVDGQVVRAGLGQQPVGFVAAAVI